MNKKEYDQLCATGSTQPLVATHQNTRRQVIYDCKGAAPPPNQMIGFASRIIVIPKNGNPRAYKSKNLSEKLHAYWNPKKDDQPIH